MGYTGERYSSVKFPGQSLAVIECGITICDSLHQVPPRIYPHPSMTFVLSGKGIYAVDDTVYELSAGQGFLINPNIINSYTADEKDPWKYLYVVFTGSDSDVIIRNAGLGKDNCVFNFELTENFISLLNSIHTACRDNNAMGYDASGYFTLAMSYLIKKNMPSRKEYSNIEQYLENAKLYIKQHYSYDMTVQELAANVGLDRTYLYRLFIDKLNMSPREYINDYRLNKAIEMMPNKNLTLPNIALSTGFYDYSYFSKQFIKKYKISPGKYRKELQADDN